MERRFRKKSHSPAYCISIYLYLTFLPFLLSYLSYPLTFLPSAGLTSKGSWSHPSWVNSVGGTTHAAWPQEPTFLERQDRQAWRGAGEDQARHEVRYRERAIKSLQKRAQELGLVLSPQAVSVSIWTWSTYFYISNQLNISAKITFSWEWPCAARRI